MKKAGSLTAKILYGVMRTVFSYQWISEILLLPILNLPLLVQRTLVSVEAGYRIDKANFHVSLAITKGNKEKRLVFLPIFSCPNIDFSFEGEMLIGILVL